MAPEVPLNRSMLTCFKSHRACHSARWCLLGRDNFGEVLSKALSQRGDAWSGTYVIQYCLPRIVYTYHLFPRGKYAFRALVRARCGNTAMVAKRRRFQILFRPNHVTASFEFPARRKPCVRIEPMRRDIYAAKTCLELFRIEGVGPHVYFA